MRRITIEFGEGNCCDVIDEYGRHTGALCFDEMLGQVVDLAHPKVRRERYAMRTPDEWADLDRMREERRRAREAAEADDPIPF